jgi:uncharacterized membrane protein (DUF485 family)
MSPPSEQPADEPRHDLADPGRDGRSARGLILFAVYLVFYGAFVFLNAFHPESMEATPALGVNIAVLYGMSLIGGAFVLALLYAFLARDRAR